MLGDRRRGRDGEQRLVLTQDRLFQADQFGARLDTELLDQRAAGVLEGAQGVGLAAAPIQRGRENRPAMLTQRRFGDPRLRLGDDVAMLTGSQPGVEQALLGRQPKLVEAGRLDAPRRPTVQHVERDATPQVQRPTKHHRRPVELPVHRQRLAAVDQCLELATIHVLGRNRQAVPRRRRLDRG